ncbi:MAG: hypothetical protein ACKO6B_08135 [Planctomycetia bacterium]
MTRFCPLPECRHSIDRRTMRLVTLSAACAALCLAAATTVHATPVASPSYVYGIDDTNRIWQIDPVQKTAEATFNTTGLSGTSNAVAFDRGRDQLFFLGGNNSTFNNDLYLWNKPLGTGPSAFSRIATRDDLSLSTTDVFNASYYDNAFWFFKEGTNDLVKASLSYGGTVPTLGGMTTYTVAGGPGGSNGFGDIAINVNTGVLYAATSTGIFYSVNLADPANGFTSIKAGGNTSLQLSFNQNYSVLYGHNYTTAAWYTVDIATGDTTALNYTTPADGSFGFRDLGGASIVDITPGVPEIDPGSMGGVIMLLVGAFGLLERRRAARVAIG